MPIKPARTRPFPEPYENPLVASADLQTALDEAIAKGPGKSWRVPVVIVSLDGTGPRPFAHAKGAELHFSASLLKVAAMYAAFELRKTLRAIAEELGPRARGKDFFKLCAEYLDPKILAMAATIPALKGAKRSHALPCYTDVFETCRASPQAALTVRYTSEFCRHLEKMIAVSDNRSASECVHGAGYGYLNGALTAAGFFDPKTNKGLWLAGDYVRKYPYLRIPSANDGLVAQGATSIELARFYTLLYDGKLVDAASSLEMLELLKKAVAVPEVFIDRAANINFKVSHTKVGLGPLKPDNGGHSVYSEASIVEHTSGRKFVVVWQNLIYGEDGFDPLGAVVARTLDGFIAKQATQPSK